MKRLMVVLAAVVLTMVAVPAIPATAVERDVVNGGGHGTIDGTTAFSQFGLEASRIADGGVSGHFNCLMAGVSEFAGFDLMAVRGKLTNVIINGDTATLEGIGMLQTGNQGKHPATFRAVVTEGGPGVGTLQLTLLAPFVFELPTETVLNGGIHLH